MVLKQYDRAVADFDKTIELNPKFVGAFISRGYLNARSGKKEEAKRDLLKAVEMDAALKKNAEKISDRFKLDIEFVSRSQNPTGNK
jgi:tetratricopeptide (TPR) repeat protein